MQDHKDHSLHQRLLKLCLCPSVQTENTRDPIYFTLPGDLSMLIRQYSHRARPVLLAQHQGDGPAPRELFLSSLGKAYSSAPSFVRAWKAIQEYYGAPWTAINFLSLRRSYATEKYEQAVQQGPGSVALLDQDAYVMGNSPKVWGSNYVKGRRAIEAEGATARLAEWRGQVGSNTGVVGAVLKQSMAAAGNPSLSRPSARLPHAEQPQHRGMPPGGSAAVDGRASRQAPTVEPDSSSGAEEEEEPAGEPGPAWPGEMARMSTPVGLGKRHLAEDKPSARRRRAVLESSDEELVG